MITAVRFRILLVSLIALTSSAYAASFDCSKANTYNEKFICSNPQVSLADAQLGEAYSKILKSFPLKGYLKYIHKNWLSSYRKCSGDEKNVLNQSDAAKNCLESINARIKFYDELSNADVYTDYAGEKDLIADGITLIVVNRHHAKVLRYFGAWRPNASMKPGKIKGFPFDGNWCEDEMKLEKRGNSFIEEENENVEIVFSDTSLSLKGYIRCGVRNGIEEGEFTRRLKITK
ncbi:MAG: lysozyme inhibitor LprI family protein [Syntrophales bacterium]